MRLHEFFQKINLFEMYRKHKRDRESKKLINEVVHQLSKQASPNRLSFEYMYVNKDNNEKS